jgi:hypothetical protein
LDPLALRSGTPHIGGNRSLVDIKLADPLEYLLHRGTSVALRSVRVNEFPRRARSKNAGCDALPRQIASGLRRTRVYRRLGIAGAQRLYEIFMLRGGPSWPMVDRRITRRKCLLLRPAPTGELGFESQARVHPVSFRSKSRVSPRPRWSCILVRTSSCYAGYALRHVGRSQKCVPPDHQPEGPAAHWPLFYVSAVTR